MNDLSPKLLHSNDYHRRQFLAGAGASLAWLALHPDVAAAATQGRDLKFQNDPFSLGVASGDPTADGVVLWTRLAPDPLRGGGMPARAIAVDWQIAEDEQMRRVVRKGRAAAHPTLAHSVHVEVRGLRPDRWYWYQFKVGPHTSPVGRTRTFPAPSASPNQLSFAFASCQSYEDGFYLAHRHLAREDLNLVVFLGDYIYEGAARGGRVRAHNGPEIKTLEDYRNRYALYKSDPDLRQSHAAFPWVATWDDHEVDNNYAADMDQDGTKPADFLPRRAAAYQAYYEHLPLRASAMPRGPGMRLYRRLPFGTLGDFFVLDTRQYRTDQPCGDGHKVRCPAALDPRATLLGADQERWLFAGLGRSAARWNILAQQIMISQTMEVKSDVRKYQMDNWNGYVAGRARLLDFVRQRRVANPVVLTGDIHSSWVCDVKSDFEVPNSPTVATEFVGTSITSGGDGTDNPAESERRLRDNSHLKFYDGQRGYVRCTVNADRWQTDYRTVPVVSRNEDAPIRTRASFVVENGRPGAQRT